MALVMVDTQVIIAVRGYFHFGKIFIQECIACIIRCADFLQGLHRFIGIMSQIGRIRQGADGQGIIQKSRMLIFFRIAGRILRLQGMDNTDFPRVIVVFENVDGACMGDHHIVQALDRAAQVEADAWRENTQQVLIARNRVDFIEGAPVAHFRVLIETELGVSDKSIHRIAVQEIALVEEPFRRIEMMQSHEGQHALIFAFRKDFMIEIHTFLICSSGPTKNKIFR